MAACDLTPVNRALQPCPSLEIAWLQLHFPSGKPSWVAVNFRSPPWKLPAFFSLAEARPFACPKSFASTAPRSAFSNGVLLLPINDLWATLEVGLASFEPGFTLEREQPQQQARAEIAAWFCWPAGSAKLLPSQFSYQNEALLRRFFVDWEDKSWFW